MQENIQDQLPFAVGDIIIHNTKGVGSVKQIINDPEPRIIIQLKDGSQWSIPSKLATVVLSELPSSGLEAQILRDKEAISNWEKMAPLKLIALALSDFGNKGGKASHIKEKLEANQLISTKWDTWWKKVQPALNKSQYFLLLRDGTYKLIIGIDQIPATPLPIPVKKKEARLTQPQLLELLRKLERNEIQFENVEGSRSKHQIAREIVQRIDKESIFKEVIHRALSGPAHSVAIILEESTKKASTKYAGQVLEMFVDHLYYLSTTSEPEKEKNRDYALDKGLALCYHLEDEADFESFS